MRNLHESSAARQTETAQHLRAWAGELRAILRELPDDVADDVLAAEQALERAAARAESLEH